MSALVELPKCRGPQRNAWWVGRLEGNNVTISELGAFGELLGCVLTLFTVAYLAMQIRQNTAQQKRDA